MTDSLWTFEEFVDATGGQTISSPLIPIEGISIDSRTLKPGDAFFALSGSNFDGHDYVKQAFKNGASIAVVSKKVNLNQNSLGPVVVVDNVYQALKNLGVRARARTKAKIVAVTGSVGKTFTKEVLKRVLSTSGKTHASIASYNNHFGVPLSLARLPKDCDFAVFELGMNAPGEIKPLSNMVKPHVAVITIVSAVHLGSFKSVKDIAREKADIFSGLESEGTVVLNADCKYTDYLTQLAKEANISKIITFGKQQDADVQLESFATNLNCICVSALVKNTEVAYKLGVSGQHLINNSLAVLAVVEVLKANLAKALLAFSELKIPKGRGDRWKLNLPNGQALLIDESYNASPLSMKAAIKSLGEVPIKRKGRHLAVLGDMLELGKTSSKFHASLLEPLNEANVDKVYCVGQQMQNLWSKLPFNKRGALAENSKKLEPILANQIQPGDIIMVKGSLGIQMGTLVEFLKTKYGKVAEGLEV